MITYNLTINDVEQIQQSIKELGGKLQSALNKLSKIESYLYNDDETDSVGIVKQVKNHTERIEELERTEKKTRVFLKWLAVLAGAVGTVIFEFVKWIFSNHKP